MLDKIIEVWWMFLNKQKMTKKFAVFAIFGQKLIGIGQMTDIVGMMTKLVGVNAIS